MEKLIQHFNEIIYRDFGIVAESVHVNKTNNNPTFVINGLTEQSRVWLKVNENILLSALIFEDNNRTLKYDVYPTNISPTEADFILSELSSVKQQILNKIRIKIQEFEDNKIHELDVDMFAQIRETIEEYLDETKFIDITIGYDKYKLTEELKRLIDIFYPDQVNKKDFTLLEEYFDDRYSDIQIYGDEADIDWDEIEQQEINDLNKLI